MLRLLHLLAPALLVVSFSGPFSRTAEAAKVSGTELLELPWDDLQGELDPSTTLLDTNPEDFVEQCSPVFLQPVTEDPFRYHYDMLDQPSGLCTNTLFCGFETCSPITNQESMTYVERFSTMNPDAEVPLFDFPNETLLEEWLSPSNPTYNLPPKVLFPKVAGDVVAAVNFAKKHNVELSVKNSGVSYIGASTKKDTLHLNMNQYKRYALNDALDGLVECDAATLQDAEIDQGLSNQPCKLAVARGKKATQRFGGGENWDKVYRAVKGWNEEQDAYKYQIVGGAAGPVTPMGWTWQAGLSGNNGGRMYGFGVDQVVQIEAVLPNGLHVRFGPTAWEEVENYVVPRTTAVSGVCNENPEDDESMWVWSSCPEDINFDDLWFAVRGGWGGTFGVILSTHYQLNDHVPFETVVLGRDRYCGTRESPEAMPQELIKPFWNFYIDFMLNPSALNISEAASNACGSEGGATLQRCLGDGAGDAFVAAWKKFLVDSNESLIASGVPASVINQAIDCNVTVEQKEDFAIEAVLGDPLFPDGRWSGQAYEGMGEAPQYAAPNEAAFNILVPKTWILENREAAIDLMMKSITPYPAFGGNTEFATDQTTSVSDAHYKAGIMLIIAYEPTIKDFNPFLQQMYDFTGSDFPAYLGANHIGPNHRGPINENWSEFCPYEWTQAERDSKCVPVQKAVWGSEKLARLEAIKKAVDPNFMFDCYLCVLNNREVVGSNGPGGDGSVETNGDGSGETSGDTSSGSGRLGLFGVLGSLLAALISHWF